MIISTTSNNKWESVSISLEINYTTLEAFYIVNVNRKNFHRKYKYKRFCNAYKLYQNFSDGITRNN